MVDVIENYSKFEVRAVVRFLQALGLNQNEIHRRLVSVYRPNISRRKYLCGVTNLKVAECH
jgi:hypothetical protein